MEEQKIKNMAILLRNGATMLDKYCPNCNNILFRLKNGQIYCPNCDREVIIVKDNLEKNTSQNSEKKSKFNKIYPFEKHTSGEIDFKELFQIFLNLTIRLSKKLQETDDLFLIEKILNNIDQTLGILKKIRDYF